MNFLNNHIIANHHAEEVFLREEVTLFSKSNRVHFFNTDVKAGHSPLSTMQEVLLPLRCVVEVHPDWYLSFIFACVEFSGGAGKAMVRQIVTDVPRPGLKVDTSGRDQEYARWILENTVEGLVPSEHNLMVKVHYPKHWEKLNASFYVEAKFKRKGWQKVLPIFGSGEVRLSDEVNLVKPSYSHTA